MSSAAGDRAPMKASVADWMELAWRHAGAMRAGAGRASSRACVMDLASALLSFDPDDFIGRAALRLAMRRYLSLLGDEGWRLRNGRVAMKSRE